ncbi:hypothetical protein WG907_05195 [Sphingobium sp. AN558]|uniref:gp53-like domain-containing protein n=1 Tax=Sphingobium sp. AN558 TaxID=3133442 RepID=UPI0030C5B811
MTPIQFMLTVTGLNALIEAQGGGSNPAQITQVGLTQSAFIMAPTVSALPGEFKRLTSVSGLAVDDTTIHMTAQDHSDDIYALRGLGLYLADGTLFAVYSQPTPLFNKASVAFFLLALDVAFSNGVSTDIVFGNSTFLMPPASETVKGVGEIATADEAAAGTDHGRIITPHTLKQLLDALRDATDADLLALANGFDTMFAGLLARTITGAGLATGGGNLTASRVLTVNAASAGDVAAGTATDRAVTPAALSGLARSLGPNGYAILPGTGGLMLQWGMVSLPAGAFAPLACSFVTSFPNAAYRVFVSCEQSLDDGDESDEPLAAYPVDQSTFNLAFSGDWLTANIAWWAIGR